MADVNDEDDSTKKFHEMGLDARLLKAIALLGWATPTLIQEKAVPLILEGKDVLVKARTGSGKTGAFALPIIQKILDFKQQNPGSSGVQALILAPSKELSRQIYNHFRKLLVRCPEDIRIVDISPQVSVETQHAVLKYAPEIIVSTPSRAVLHLTKGSFSIQTLRILVIDEADLIFSFGYEDDINKIIRYLPRVYQAILASATLTDDVTSLKGLLLRNCVSLKLKEPIVAPVAQLTHYKLFADEREKGLILYSVLKLGLVNGRSIIFVNSVNKCYKLKLFLQQFEISTCILNSELPAISRIHALSQFNDGKYNIIITSDETEISDVPGDKKSQLKGRILKDKESGVSRGIDFRDVSNVINFDFPKSVSAYIHRVGRTARGAGKGTAISFISIPEAPLLEEVDAFISKGFATQESSIFNDFKFNMNEVEGLHYRVKEAWKVVTRVAIKEARLAEIRQEILNTKKLKHYFKDNPKDLELLRHDKASHIIKLPEHVSNVPEYLIPQSLRGIPGLIQKKKRARPNPKAGGLVRNKHKARMEDPLSNFDILENEEKEHDEYEEPKAKRKKFFNGRRKY